MRHNITAAIVIASTLAFGGCSTLSSLTPTTISTNTATLLDDVSAITSTVCKFIPTAETVAGLATTASISATAAVGLASAIANTICGAVAPVAPAASVAMRGLGKRKATFRSLGVTPPTVDGVTIQGYFVQ